MWKLDGTVARLLTPPYAIQVDLTRPQAGLQLSRLGDTSSLLSQSRILQIHFPAEYASDDLQDAWIRGTDLVAIYAQTSQRQVQPEVYWRLVEFTDQTLNIELIVSVQTELLDASPNTCIQSEFAADEIAWLTNPDDPSSVQLFQGQTGKHEIGPGGPGVFVFRHRDIDFSYVEMIHCLDYRFATISWQSGVARLESELFYESLEKGVIRRGRARGILVPRSRDVAVAALAYRAFCDSPPPLTT